MAIIPKSFQDYDDDDPDIERRKMRYHYWKTLFLLREEYYRTESINRDNNQFIQWVENTYGFRPIMNDSGFTDDYMMVDEKKFIVYILKYGK